MLFTEPWVAKYFKDHKWVARQRRLGTTDPAYRFEHDDIIPVSDKENA